VNRSIRPPRPSRPNRRARRPDGAVDHGVAASAYSTLTPGTYELVCFVQGADHVPHVAKGMLMPFRVGAPAPHFAMGMSQSFTVERGA